MNVSVKRVLHFPGTKIIIGIVVCFSLLVSIQNFVSKPIIYSIIQDKSIADPIIHCVSILVLLGSYFFLFRLYDKRRITEVSVKYLLKEMFGGFILGFLTISLSVFFLYLLGYYQVISLTTAHYPVKLFTTLLVAALIEDLLHRALIAREVENWPGTNIAIIIGMLVEVQHIFNTHSNLFMTQISQG